MLFSISTTGRRGAALGIVLALCALISLSAITLFTTTHLETLIAGNIRRHAVARHAAASGMTHLMSLNIPVPNLVRALREQSVTSGTALPKTSIPGTRSHYKVELSICCGTDGHLLPGDTILAISTGMLVKGEQIISESRLVATIKWVQ